METKLSLLLKDYQPFSVLAQRTNERVSPVGIPASSPSSVLNNVQVDGYSEPSGTEVRGPLNIYYATD